MGEMLILGYAFHLSRLTNYHLKAQFAACFKKLEFNLHLIDEFAQDPNSQL